MGRGRRVSLNKNHMIFVNIFKKMGNKVWGIWGLRTHAWVHTHTYTHPDTYTYTFIHIHPHRHSPIHSRPCSNTFPPPPTPNTLTGESQAAGSCSQEHKSLRFLGSCVLGTHCQSEWPHNVWRVCHCSGVSIDAGLGSVSRIELHVSRLGCVLVEMWIWGCRV